MSSYRSSDDSDKQNRKIKLKVLKTTKKQSQSNQFCNSTNYQTIPRLPFNNINFKFQSEPSLESRWSINNFQILQELGKGKFGQVYAAKQLNTDYLVAIKKMSRKQLNDHNFNSQIKREIIIQSALNHNNILKLYGYFWDSQSIYLILQYAPGGQLYKYLQQRGKIDEQNISVIVRQVCQGLLYLHAKNIIHRDLKPENILVSNNSVKIADFGWSIHSESKRETLCGTLDYLAPQMIKRQTHDNKIDVWCVGILAFQLATSKPPFQMHSCYETHQKIIDSEVKFPSFISYQLRVLIRKCLIKDSEQRITIREILQEPFIERYKNKVLKL